MGEQRKLSAAQRMALRALSEAGAQLTAHDIGEQLQWDTAYAAAVLRALARRDLLEACDATSAQGPRRKAFRLKAAERGSARLH